MPRFVQWLGAFAPVPVAVAKREVLYSCVGACLGLLGAYWICQHTLGGFNVWFVAPMGASAVLLFAVPSSPMAQPWSIVGGNLVSASIGVACALWIDDTGLAVSVAAALAIAVMFALRCLHPPSGAVALTAVLGGPPITSLGFQFVIWPVAVNSVMLLVAALLFNAAVGRRYPHGPHANANAHLTRDEPPSARLGFTTKDLDDALQQRGELLDISKDDLEELFIQAEHRAYRRHFGDVRCEDIMSKDVVTVSAHSPSSTAWQLMIFHAVKALPVVDAERHLLGIVTLHDFFLDHASPDAALPSVGTDARVQHIMTEQVQTAQPQHMIVDLISAFSDGGRHHLPVLDEHRKLVGMVTQSDMVAALYRAALDSRAT